MVKLKYTDTFKRWMRSLADRSAKARIIVRAERLVQGNSGDCKSVGEQVSELRIHYGPGYRVYFTRCGNTVILLLCGGTKSTQQADIRQARQLAKNWTDSDEND
ncbi:MAG: type II toxin-antitoxin system RelE/ParE family toxin [Lautropia sp.]|nr:MAG: type II toxin-antitoxin system RelE/ParE family toxin [Lautropia sp.]